MKAWLHDMLEITKARICFLAIIMAALGYVLASPGDIATGHLVVALFGIALLGGSCGILNQVMERDIDALMHRTRLRPLPAGRMSVKKATTWGFALGIAGLLILVVKVNLLTAILGLATLVSYLGIYTPLKRISTASTLVGAIPGAMPPLMGWTAASGSLGGEGLLLFAILVVWQIPHFLAIAWVYREDYARAGLPILSVIDRDGVVTSRQVVLYLVALIPLTLVPSLWGVTGFVYLIGALVLGFGFLYFGILLAVNRSAVYARRLFIASLVYLPILGALMCWDHV